MQRGDYFYLCHGNDVQLFGQVTSGLEKPNAKCVERRYLPIRSCRAKDSTYSGPKKYWAPNANTTSKLVPRGELESFERLVLKPFFRLSLRELTNRLADESIDEFLFDTLLAIDHKEYEEARSRLILHERIERQRNKELVSDAKARFKMKHRRLFCEACGFDFSDKYGERGVDFIEAHHRVPIAKLKSGTLLKIKDLAMVCANCHRMLHRPPWTSVGNLRIAIRRQGQLT
jgi:predicted HNH restriction endonuclease